MSRCWRMPLLSCWLAGTSPCRRCRWMAGPWSRGLERASSGLQVDIEALRFVDEGFRSDHEAGSSKMEGITSPGAPTP